MPKVEYLSFGAKGKLTLSEGNLGEGTEQLRQQIGLKRRR